jgi:NTP pyrophosphatase (non-canonical NTP hydrolase)
MTNGADRNQDPFIWGAILGEEVGEFHQAVLHDRFGGKAAGTREEACKLLPWHCKSSNITIA